MSWQIRNTHRRALNNIPREEWDNHAVIPRLFSKGSNARSCHPYFFTNSVPKSAATDRSSSTSGPFTAMRTFVHNKSL